MRHAEPLHLLGLIALWAMLLHLGSCRSTLPQTPATPPRNAPRNAPYILALGTAQDGGLPQIGCRRPCCEAARLDPSRQRLVTSLLVVDPVAGKRFLLDASPHLPEQVERARAHAAPTGPGRPALFDGIFITHAHLGHYAGLAYLGREAYGSAPTDVWGTPSLLGYLEANGPWSLLLDAEHVRPRTLQPGERLQLTDRLALTAVEVPHRAEFSDAVGFLVEGPEASLLYLPDIDKWERWEDPIEGWIARVDHALLDGTFFDGAEIPGRDMSEIPHPFIAESLQRFEQLPAPERSKVWFTHLNHSNPAADPSSAAAEAVRAAGHRVLRDGTLLAL